MFFAYRALTLDIISFYIFGQCTNALDTTNFAAPILFYIQSALPMLWVIKSFSWASWTFPFVSLLSKPFSVHFNGLISLRSFIGNWVHQCILNDAKLLESSNSVALYHRFLLPGRDTTPSGYPQYVIDEAISLLQAGSDTVGNACTTGTAYILQNPTVFSRLFQELQTSWPDGQESIRLSELERLPYLVCQPSLLIVSLSDTFSDSRYQRVSSTVPWVRQPPSEDSRLSRSINQRSPCPPRGAY